MGRKPTTKTQPAERPLSRHRKFVVYVRGGTKFLFDLITRTLLIGALQYVAFVAENTWVLYLSIFTKIVLAIWITGEIYGPIRAVTKFALTDKRDRNAAYGLTAVAAVVIMAIVMGVWWVTDSVADQMAKGGG